MSDVAAAENVIDRLIDAHPDYPAGRFLEAQIRLAAGDRAAGRAALELFLAQIGEALADGKHLEIRGFGTFKVTERKARMARNPRTGEAVPVPARRVPVFKVSKMLKDRVARV